MLPATGNGDRLGLCVGPAVHPEALFHPAVPASPSGIFLVARDSCTEGCREH